ncbi:MAG: FAD-dependent oxidoreductase [Armatimonadetes bacterium]|nr:FAD-dependent oxidoreductase [Armatimonadota bacterium]
MPVAAGPQAQEPDTFRLPAVHVEVLVVSGTPAGTAAALAAARRGRHTLLVEERPFLGGDMTGVGVNTFDMNYGPKKQRGEQQNLTRGIFLEFLQKLGVHFDVEQAKRLFLEKVASQPRLTLWLNTDVVRAIVRDGTLLGVITQNKITGARAKVIANQIVDATDDADVAALTGVPYRFGREESGLDRLTQPATLIFRMGGVDWGELTQYLQSERKQGRIAGAWMGYAWGYSSIMHLYVPTSQRLAVYDMNLGRQRDGTVLINSLQIFGVDGTSEASANEATALARAEMPRLINFLRQNATGFARAYLVETMPYLYVRETRHIEGMYRLTAEDIIEEKVFWDRIAVASYPIDLHPYTPDFRNYYGSRRYVYTIPFRSLVPVRVDNLLVASRSISATYEAAGSVRVVPTTFSLGEAAGIAASVSVELGIPPRHLARSGVLVQRLQGILQEQGAYLGEPRLPTASVPTAPGSGALSQARTRPATTSSPGGR